MSGYHGTVGATGVGPTVCPEPLHKALLLAGLIAGILFAVWFSSAPAHAEELSFSEPELPGTGVVVERAEELGSVGETVAEIGDRATRTVSGASEAAQTVETQTPDPVRHVHEAVRSVPLPDPGGLPETLAPVTGQVVDPVSEDADDSDETGVTDEAGQDPEEPEVEETATHLDTPPPHEQVVPDPGQTTDSADTDDDRRVLGPDTLDPSAAGAAAPAMAPTTGGTATAPVVAGYLTTTVAPAPAPGLFESARHVLRSAPADPTDEPTFSPD